MATYIEIRNLFNDSELRNKVATAVVIAAEGILNEGTSTAERKAWAAKAFAAPESEAVRITMTVLAANKDATVTAIQGATDVAIQTNVNDAINLFIDADAGI